jgi:hypothetical protein
MLIADSRIAQIMILSSVLHKSTAQDAELKLLFVNAYLLAW